jgi:membrane protease YdiL (CAAX protease family)
MSIHTATPRHFRLALFWAVLGGLASLAVFPYALSLAPIPAAIPVPLPILAILSAVQTGVLLLLLCWVGLRLGFSLKFDSPLARAWINHHPLPPVSQVALRTAFGVGVVGGFILMGLDLAFQPWMPATPTPIRIELWKRLLACFYGGITEELLLRLFCTTLIAWLLWKTLQRGRSQPTAQVVWVAIASAALLFGIGHLPAAARVWALTPVVITRTIALNALLGVPFGWLYWRYGLEYAMLSHFCADLVLHGIGGS